MHVKHKRTRFLYFLATFQRCKVLFPSIKVSIDGRGCHVAMATASRDVSSCPGSRCWWPHPTHHPGTGCHLFLLCKIPHITLSPITNRWPFQCSFSHCTLQAWHRMWNKCRDAIFPLHSLVCESSRHERLCVAMTLSRTPMCGNTCFYLRVHATDAVTNPGWTQRVSSTRNLVVFLGLGIFVQFGARTYRIAWSTS